MRIAILSNLPKAYSTLRLKKTAREKGHTVRVLSPIKFTLDIKSQSPGLYYKGKSVGKFDAVIPRIGATSNAYGITVLRQFEQMGAFCLNPSHAVSLTRDKLRSMQALSRHRVGMPPSAVVYDKSDIKPAIERLGGAPLIIKVQEGTHGSGVMLVEKSNLAEAIVDALHTAKQKVLMQKFVSESSGRDIRAFVVGDRVVAAMRRVAKDGEFRSNVHLGANVEAIDIDPEFEKVALKAAHVTGLRVTGVDLLEAAEGPQVLEVNSSPGLEGIESATKIDVANEIISYIEEQVNFPELDIREKLSLERGYSVVEMPVCKESVIVDKPISDSILSDVDIKVLSITRDSLPIQMPTSEVVIRANDVLLCYGKHHTLKTIMPSVLKKKKVRKSKKLTKSMIKEVIEESLS